jgi:hypothetical protein
MDLSVLWRYFFIEFLITQKFHINFLTSTMRHPTAFSKNFDQKAPQ